jgi:4-hydroxy-tetrahydrodipicolinate synthase
MVNRSLQGSIVALVTPMCEEGRLDLDALRALIDWHIDEGSNGIVVGGTSGESPTLCVDEHCLLIGTAVEYAAGRIPVIAGAGGNSTLEAIALTTYAKKAGATATLQVVPYYNKPTQQGLIAHFSRIAEQVDLPLILYNVPRRTGLDMDNATVLRLTQVPGIIGVKDATGHFARGAQLIRSVPADFAVYSGDDASAVALMLMGGCGNISVSANVAPHAMRQLCDAARCGDAKRAREIHMKLLPMHEALFIESNPIPVKWALTQLGKIQGGIRLPLTPLAERHRPLLQSALQQAGVLPPSGAAAPPSTVDDLCSAQ